MKTFTDERDEYGEATFLEELFWGPDAPESVEEHAARLAAARDILAELHAQADYDDVSARNAAYADMLMSAARCPAAHPEDGTACHGPQTAVRVVDQHGDETPACVHHGARLYASLVRPRVYPVPGHDGAAIEVFQRAQRTRPFAWLTCPGRAA